MLFAAAAALCYVPSGSAGGLCFLPVLAALVIGLLLMAPVGMRGRLPDGVWAVGTSSAGNRLQSGFLTFMFSAPSATLLCWSPASQRRQGRGGGGVRLGQGLGRQGGSDPFRSQP